MLIRPATASDAPAIAAIYDHHARSGTATFDTEGPDAAAWAAKLASTQSRGWPFLVADADGVVAYAYATQFRDRPGYAPTCEDSIYVASGRQGEGVGRQLLERLIADARRSGFEQMIAVVGGGEPASIALHRRLGFIERGRMRDVGVKFGQKLDTVYLQLALT
jgi:L-amino acid N-acyltransferase YncA